MGEVKKKIFVGDSFNRAEVTEEDGNMQSLEAGHARELMREAGRLFKPIGFEYIGSGAIHYYEKKGLTGPEFVHVCQTDVRNVEEMHASLGWTALRSAFYKSYGRKEPKTRDA